MKNKDDIVYIVSNVMFETQLLWYVKELKSLVYSATFLSLPCAVLKLLKKIYITHQTQQF